MIIETFYDTFDDEWNFQTHPIHNQEKTKKNKAMSLQDIFKDLLNNVEEVAELFDISSEQAFLFFQQNNYKMPSFDNNIPSWIYETAYIKEKSNICMTAFCEDSESFITYMCGHTFCIDCWQGYIASQVREGATSIHTTCMGEKCSQKLSPLFVLENLQDEKDLYKQYQTYLVNDMMEKSGMQGVRWCSAGCSAILTSELCVCGAVTCLGCGDKDHRPMPCDLVKIWKQITSATDANETWLKSRTKPCPKCKTPIEKNEGCHHMGCSKCKFHWCWVCLEDWSKHGYGNPCAEPTDDAKSLEKDRLATNQFLTKVNFYFFKQKQAEEQRKTLAKHAEFLRCELEKSLLTVQRADAIVGFMKKMMNALSFYGRMMPLFYFIGLSKTRDLLQNNVDFFHKLVQEAVTYCMECTANKCEESEVYRKLQTDSKLLETRQKNLLTFIASIDSELQYKSEGNLDGWGCGICEHINQATDAWCKKCMACVSHQEKKCVVCTNKWVRNNPY
jgi:hypothetical protein